ncbi:protein kinase domain-containing protein [Kocuria sabuli]|uniref:protein kinase domain-containing protein n=1 Tax=Kocuria sabuli TaxID=3071448 RepID=UPI0034D3B0F1
MTSSLVDDRGKTVTLGPKLGEGGEGAVYKLAADDRLAVKIYSRDMSPERVQKIQVLSRMNGSSLDRYVTRPMGLVRDAKGKPRGLIMPVVGSADDVHYLYNPSSRRKKFPTATWAFLVHVAANIARAFASVHQLGLVIGDVNPGSVLVLSDGTVRLIDVDSFQVPVSGSRPLLCTVAVPMFLPPELHGAPLDKTVRTPNHDAFGLAVMIFHLLALGRHPYVGRFLGSGDMPVDKAVAENRFAYGAKAAQYQMAKPPNAIGLSVLPPEVAALFEAAFADSRTNPSRPTAVQWLDALTRLQKELTRCSQSTTHHYYRGLSVCPWCEFEQAVGRPLFEQAARPVNAGPTKVGSVEEQYKKLSKFFAGLPPAGAQSTSVGSRKIIAPSVVPPSSERRPVEWVGVFVGVLCFLGGIIGGGGGGLYFMAVSIGCMAWGILAPRSRRPPWEEEYRAALRAYEKAGRDFDFATQAHLSNKIRRRVADMHSAWQELPSWKRQEIAKLETQKREAQRRRFLESRLIEDAYIKGVGASRVTMLSSFNINTAWDIERQKILQVPTFGPVLADRLVAWRMVEEGRFVFRSGEPLPADALASLDQQVEKKQSKIVADLASLKVKYESMAAVEAQEIGRQSVKLNAAERRFRDAEAQAKASMRTNSR